MSIDTIRSLLPTLRLWYFDFERYSGLQKGMSIVSIITFDIIEKILNFYYNKNMTMIRCIPFLQGTVH